MIQFLFIILLSLAFGACHRASSSAMKINQPGAVDLEEDFERSLLSLSETSPSADNARCSSITYFSRSEGADCKQAKSSVYQSVLNWSREMRERCRGAKGRFIYGGKQNPQGSACGVFDSRYQFTQGVSVSCEGAVECGQWNAGRPMESPASPVAPPSCGSISWNSERSGKTCAEAKELVYAETKAWSRLMQSACTNAQGKHRNLGKENSTGTDCHASGGEWIFQQQISAACELTDQCTEWRKTAAAESLIAARPASSSSDLPPALVVPPFHDKIPERKLALPAVQFKFEVDDPDPSSDCRQTEEETTEESGTSEPERCGDEIQQGSEGCDDGNQESGDGCSAACQLEEISRRGSPSWGAAAFDRIFLPWMKWITTSVNAEALVPAPLAFLNYEPKVKLRPLTSSATEPALRGRDFAEQILSQMPGCPTDSAGPIIACVDHAPYRFSDLYYHVQIGAGCAEKKKAYTVQQVFLHSPQGNPNANHLSPSTPGTMYLSGIEEKSWEAIHEYYRQEGKRRGLGPDAIENKFLGFQALTEHIAEHERQHVRHNNAALEQITSAYNDPKIPLVYEVDSAEAAKNLARTKIQEYLADRIPKIEKSLKDCTDRYHEQEALLESYAQRLRACSDLNESANVCENLPDPPAEYFCEWPDDPVAGN